MRLDQRKFRRWLASKKPEDVVGHHRDCHTCPIALFYADACGAELVIFSRDDGYRVDRGDGGRRLPYWAERFVMTVDREPDARITAGRALELLRATP